MDVHDPVFQEINDHSDGLNPLGLITGKWYFWDETWADAYGPFDTEAQARTELARYVREVLGEVRE